MTTELNDSECADSLDETAEKDYIPPMEKPPPPLLEHLDTDEAMADGRNRQANLTSAVEETASDVHGESTGDETELNAASRTSEAGLERGPQETINESHLTVEEAEDSDGNSAVSSIIVSNESVSQDNVEDIANVRSSNESVSDATDAQSLGAAKVTDTATDVSPADLIADNASESGESPEAGMSGMLTDSDTTRMDAQDSSRSALQCDGDTINSNSETAAVSSEVADAASNEVSTEAANDVSEEEEPRLRTRPGRSGAVENGSIAEMSFRDSLTANDMTKKISSWISSFWVSKDENNEQANGANEEDDYVRFKKGLLESLEKENTESGGDTSVEDSVWLMGVRYEMPEHSSLEQNPPFYETANYYLSTPGSFPHLPQTQGLQPSLYPSEFYEDFMSRIWCTYRHNFAAIRPTNYTSDAGWGCMLRSGQSLLANALVIQFLGRGWRRVQKSQDTWDTYVQILTWFLDDMSSRCPFSVHRIALLGKQLGKNIGEWFGPSTASQAIKALVENFSPAQMSVHVATDGVVYKKEVYKAAGNNQARKDFQSVLILVAIRLGISNLNPIYYDAVKACFSFPESVGIAGGKPSSSYYFIGLRGDDLFYLDPHYSRPAIEPKNAEDYTEEDLATFHCDVLRKIHMSQLDPSMLLGFYCRTEEDFEEFCNRVNEVNTYHTPVFTIAEEAPVYGDEDDIITDDDDELADDNVGKEKEHSKVNEDSDDDWEQ